jgi:hypothetical protein
MEHSQSTFNWKQMGSIIAALTVIVSLANWHTTSIVTERLIISEARLESKLEKFIDIHSRFPHASSFSRAEFSIAWEAVEKRLERIERLIEGLKK